MTYKDTKINNLTGFKIYLANNYSKRDISNIFKVLFSIKEIEFRRKCFEVIKLLLLITGEIIEFLVSLVLVLRLKY